MNDLNAYLSNTGGLINRQSINMMTNFVECYQFLENSHVNLINQKSIETIINIKTEADKYVNLCKDRIKEIKKDKNENPNQNIESLKLLNEELQIWKTTKYEFFQLRNLANQRKELIEARNKLYDSSELPESINFTEKMKILIKDYPNFQSDLSHFQQVLSMCMQHNREEPTLQDVKKINEFLVKLEHSDLQGSAVHGSVKRLNECLETSLQQKERALKNVWIWCQAENISNKKYQDWTPKQKIRFLVEIEQILKNPFQPRFNVQQFFQHNEEMAPLCALVQELQQLPASTENIFWKKMSPFESHMHELAKTPEHKEYLYECKIEGLKRIMALSKPNEEASNHLIVGAGPAGLLRALYFKLQNQPFELIEKRAPGKTLRLNTLTLGKWEPRELEILFFLGAIPLLEDKASFGHNQPQYIEVKIGDLESALEKILLDLNNHKNPVNYETQVKGISKKNNQAEIILVNNHTKEKRTLMPASVIITDGFNGSTKQLVGVSRVDLAKPTLVTYSLFKKAVQQKEQPQDSSSSFQYRVLNGVKGGLVITRILGETLLFQKNKEQAYAASLEGGPSGLSRLPDQEYLLRVLKKEEQHLIERDYKKGLTEIDRKIKRQEEKNNPKSEIKKQALKTLKNEKEKELDKYLGKKSAELRGVLDFLQGVYHPEGHKMEELKSSQADQNVLVDTIITKSERSVVKVGNIPCLIRGDACHTTDPYTGTGCKTAMEELLADQYSFQQGAISQMNELDLSILEWGQDFYQQRMINSAFEERNNYYSGTEAETRYVDLAVRNNVISPAEADYLLRLLAKDKIPARQIPVYDTSGWLHMTLPDEARYNKLVNETVQFTEEDIKFLENLQKRFEHELSEYLAQKTTDPGIDYLSKSENDLFNKATKFALGAKAFLSNDEKLGLEIVFSKLCCKDRREGFILKLLLQQKDILANHV